MDFGLPLLFLLSSHGYAKEVGGDDYAKDRTMRKRTGLCEVVGSLCEEDIMRRRELVHSVMSL
jgi:hypothetical protein